MFVPFSCKSPSGGGLKQNVFRNALDTSSNEIRVPEIKKANVTENANRIKWPPTQTTNKTSAGLFLFRNVRAEQIVCVITT